MRTWGFIIVICSSVLSACNTDESMKELDPYIFLHDNSSKIWLVDQLLINKNDYSPMRFKYKQMIAFHESRNAYIHTVKDFGEHHGLKALYTMDRAKREFRFQFNKKEWIFHIVYLSRTKIVLRPKYKSFNYTMVLIPFPEY